MTDIPVIGIDLGYGRVKVAGPGFRASFPAVVAEPSAWSESTGLIEFGGQRFLVGDPALNESHHRYSARVDKIATPEERAKFMTSLALASRHYDCNVFAVCSGLPPAHYKDAELKTQLANAMTGAFAFRFEGRQHLIEVASVSVDPQAGAAMYAALLHDYGEPAISPLQDQRVIVLDPGHRTTDIALMHGRKAALGARSILTSEHGVWSLYEEVARLLLRDHRVNLTPAQIDSAWRQNGSLRIGGQPVQLAPYILAAGGPIARAIVADVQRQAGDVRLWDTCLLVGGGARLFYEVLLSELGIPVQVAEEPEYANAVGYYRRQMERR